MSVYISLFLCVHVCVSTCLCVGAHGGQKGKLEPLELELPEAVSCPRVVVTRNQLWVLCRSSTELSLQPILFFTYWPVFCCIAQAGLEFAAHLSTGTHSKSGFG